MAGVVDVAVAILEQTGKRDTFSLQKLVYYCQGWSLARSGQPMFPEPIEAWRDGPVSPILFREHKGALLFGLWRLKHRGASSDRLTPEQVATVRFVVRKYSHLS